MKTIEVGFTTIDYDLPERLINVATLEDIEKIYKIADALKGMERALSSFAVDVVLFDIPEDSKFRYNVSYVKCYLSKDGEIGAYQYFQGKYGSGDQVESEYIDLKELKKYLIEKTKRKTIDFKYLYKGNYSIRLNKGVIDHVTRYKNGSLLFSEPYDKVAHKRIVDLFEEDLKGLKI